MKPGNKNSFNSKSKIKINNQEYTFYSIPEAEKNGLDGVSKIPKSLKVLLYVPISRILFLIKYLAKFEGPNLEGITSLIK